MLRGGLIGCGFFSTNHLHGWRLANGADIVALCDQDADRLNAAGDAFGITARYRDAAEMMARENLDFVDIVTTAPSHPALVKLAAGHGLHIICQKPFAENLADARDMVAAAQEADKVLMVHENFRWQAPIRRVAALLRDGVIGTPYFCRASFRSGHDIYAGQPYLATGQRFIIEDLGIHILDVARALMGDVARIAATTTRVNPAIRGEDVATMLLTHESGMTTVADCSYATRRRPETFPETLLEIDGGAGTLRLEAGYRLTIDTAQGSETLNADAPLLDWAERPWHVVQQSVAAIQSDFVACLAEGRSPETAGADNLKTLELVEAAYQSAATGRTVDMATLT